MRYNFDIAKWVLWMLPAVLRKPRLIAWLNVLVAPIGTLHLDFLSSRAGFIEAVTVTPQVCYLRGVLNNRLDALLRRIRILDFQQGGQTWIFTEAEQRPLYLPNFLEKGERFDFIVEVPFELKGQKQLIESLLNVYKLPSKVYKINFV